MLSCKEHSFLALKKTNQTTKINPCWSELVGNLKHYNFKDSKKGRLFPHRRVFLGRTCQYYTLCFQHCPNAGWEHCRHHRSSDIGSCMGSDLRQPRVTCEELARERSHKAKVLQARRLLCPHLECSPTVKHFSQVCWA